MTSAAEACAHPRPRQLLLGEKASWPGMFGTTSVLFPSGRTFTSHGGPPSLPTNHPVTNTTHSFTTLNLSALLGAGHTQSPVSSAGPVWQDLGTLGYITVR